VMKGQMNAETARRWVLYALDMVSDCDGEMIQCLDWARLMLREGGKSNLVSFMPSTMYEHV
jgi:hypothetical protein